MKTTKNEIAGCRFSLINCASVEAAEKTITISVVDGKFARDYEVRGWDVLADQMFVKHHGVVFIGESIADLRAYRAKLEKSGKPVAVIMTVDAVKKMKQAA